MTPDIAPRRAAAPIVLALFAWAVLRQLLGLRQVCGVGLGFAGLALMAYFASTGGGFSPLGAALTLAAAASWAGGSLWARRLRLPSDPVVTLAVQLVASAVLLMIVMSGTGIAGRTDLADLPATAWLALAYLSSPARLWVT